MLLCGAVAAALFALWFANALPKYLKGAVLAMFAAAVIFIAEGMIVTDAERVEAAIYDLAEAFQRQDVDRTLSHISEQAPEERALVSRAIGMVQIEDDLRITDVNVELIADDSRARSTFRANATAQYAGHRDRARTRWLFTWQREEDDWRVIRIERLNVLDDRTIDPMANRAD